MNPDRPVVSVLATTYNHEKYIGEAIRSILGQTFPDFEAVVIDDGSADGTGRVVRSFADPRVRYLRQANQGPSAATTAALAACRGEYVALMSGDDVLHPDRLRTQVEAYRRGPTRLLFAGAEMIDDEGRPLGDDYYPEILTGPGAGRARHLERLFDSWPGFYGVTAFTEARVLAECGPDDPALFQTQDYARWIKLLKRYDLEVLPERLYRLRIRAGWENLSGPQPEKQIRAFNERYLVMKSFFEDFPPELFREAFRRRLIRPDFSSPAEQACEEAFLFLNSPVPLVPLIGVERLHRLLHDPASAEVLRSAYGFDFLRFAETLKRLNVANLFPGHRSAVVVDLGDGWSGENAVRQPYNPHVPQFRFVFDLGRFSSPRHVAWAPSEEPRFGRVKVERFHCRAADGSVYDIGPDDISCLGCSRVGGYYVFDTADPRLVFSPRGPLKEVEIAGRLELTPPGEAFARMSAALAEKQATIERLTRARWRDLASRVVRRCRRLLAR